MSHTAFHMMVFSNTLLLYLKGFSQTREMSVLRVITKVGHLHWAQGFCQCV